MTEQKIGVVGGGLMGHDIAYLLAAAGHAVDMFEPAGVRNRFCGKRPMTGCSA